jgi:hypothetical protein
MPGAPRAVKSRQPFAHVIPGSRPEFIIGPAFGRTRWAAPRNVEEYLEQQIARERIEMTHGPQRLAQIAALLASEPFDRDLVARR